MHEHSREVSVSRRDFLSRSAALLAALSLARPSNGMTAIDGIASPNAGGKAKSIIWLFMNGGPSQLDLFDEKKILRERDGEPIPDSVVGNERFAFIRGKPRLLGSPYRFARHGESGAAVSELLPETARIVDRLCFIRSLHNDAFNHAPAEFFVNSGLARIGRPSMGSWVDYGIGTSNPDLPGFVVLVSGGGQPSGGTSCWGSGFLSPTHQGVELRSRGDAVLFVRNPPGIDEGTRGRTIAALRALNRHAYAKSGDPETSARIAAYDLSERMQRSVPELMDLARESDETLAAYGARPGESSFANNCLLARRLVERGVRFVQLYHRGWDSHGTGPHDDLMTSLPRQCRDTDRAAAALIEDLDRRGLLDQTLVVWGGEFGRTPMNEERNGSKFKGRDHHPRAQTMWLSGGGIRPGVSLGETDEFGYSVIKDPVHVNDLHATLLRCLGIDHLKLTYRHQGRDFRLTDVGGRVMHEILA